MEPNKLENEFRNKLNEREINPSANAWDRLDAMLTVAEKPQRNLKWLYIAASLLGFGIIGSLYFNQIDNVIYKWKDDLVIQDSVTPTTTTMPANNIDEKSRKSESVVASVVKKSTTKTNEIQVVREESIGIKSNKNQVAESSIVKEKSIQPQSNTVTVDELLAAVENPPIKEKQFNQKPVVQVNASSLLSQIDGELELSFREKVINRVSKNYQTVKVALANRNLE
jgi:hypothetical protein